MSNKAYIVGITCHINKMDKPNNHKVKTGYVDGYILHQCLLTTNLVGITRIHYTMIKEYYLKFKRC